MEKVAFHYDRYDKDYLIALKDGNAKNQTISGIVLSRLEPDELKIVESGETNKTINEKAFRTFKVSGIKKIKVYN